MSHSCFIHSPTDGHLHFFQILVIINNTALVFKVRCFVGLVSHVQILKVYGLNVGFEPFAPLEKLLSFLLVVRRHTGSDVNVRLWLSLSYSFGCGFFLFAVV